MYKLLSCIAVFLFSLQAAAQEKYTVSKDPENGAQVFKGPITFADLGSEPSFGWFGKGETAYTPDAATIGYLREKLPQYSIVTIMGTWCEDSQNLVPRLAKTLQEANFPLAQLRLYGVDRSKQTNGNEAQTYKLQLVPTIILLKDDREVGRIVETVKQSIEKDLAAIIRKANQ